MQIYTRMLGVANAKPTLLTVVGESGALQGDRRGVQLVRTYLDWIIPGKREGARGAIRDELGGLVRENAIISLQFHLDVVHRTDRVGTEHAEADQKDLLIHRKLNGIAFRFSITPLARVRFR